MQLCVLPNRTRDPFSPNDGAGDGWRRSQSVPIQQADVLAEDACQEFHILGEQSCFVAHEATNTEFMPAGQLREIGDAETSFVNVRFHTFVNCSNFEHSKC